MPANRTPAVAIQATIDGLAQPRDIKTLGPIAARFIYSLRLIALHQKAKRDPIPELAARHNSVNVAAKALALSQTVSSIWPENIHVSRFCCCKLTHDEVTIAASIEAASHRDHSAFKETVDGLLRPERAERLWENVVELVEAELTAI